MPLRQVCTHMHIRELWTSELLGASWPGSWTADHAERQMDGEEQTESCCLHQGILEDSAGIPQGHSKSLVCAEQWWSAVAAAACRSLAGTSFRLQISYPSGMMMMLSAGNSSFFQSELGRLDAEPRATHPELLRQCWEGRRCAMGQLLNRMDGQCSSAISHQPLHVLHHIRACMCPLLILLTPGSMREGCAICDMGYGYAVHSEGQSDTALESESMVWPPLHDGRMESHRACLSKPSYTAQAAWYQKHCVHCP